MADSDTVTRRDMLKMSVAAGAVTAARPRLARATPALPAGRPHILLIMADQHRGDCLGADGNAAIHTPNLDEIARAGARFRQAYTLAPSCIPARAVLLTGQRPWTNGLLSMANWPIAPSYASELPQALQDAGYLTMGIGKMEFGPIRSTSHGFEQMILNETAHTFRTDYTSWFWSEAPDLNPLALGLNWNAYPSKPYPYAERLHSTRWTGDTAIRFIRNYRKRDPFFLKVSFIAPHSPYTPPDRLLRQYLNATLPPAETGNWDARYKPRSGPGLDIWHGDLGAEQVHQSRAGYYGQVSFVDEQIGRILEALDRRGWLENTVILYTSDHGDMLGDHYLWRKCQPYQSDLRIPLLLRWPRGLVNAKHGQVISRPVSLADVLPTLVEAAGGKASPNVDGHSLFQLVRGEESGWPETVELEHGVCYSNTVNWNALTDGHRKYIFHAYDGWEQLFDLDQDPGESNDLAMSAAHQSQLRQWRERMVETLAPRGDAYVQNGKLMPRRKAMPISPNYPRQAVLDFLHARGIAKYQYSVPERDFVFQE